MSGRCDADDDSAEGAVDDAGIATVLVLGLTVVLLAVAAVLASLGSLLVARHQATSAADLAALSVAQHALEGEEAACAAARTVAGAQGATVVRCHLEPDLDAVVTVAVPLPGRLEPLGRVTAVARAGLR